VVAHLGQPYYEDLVALASAYPNAWTDLSFVLGARLVDADRLVAIVRDFGIDRVMFGTDFPFFDPADSLNALTDAGFSPGELEALTTANAERLFFTS
jgi:predicted TIM-barrel fold metal-dependent hydrolase